MKRQVPKHQHHVFNSIQTMHCLHAIAWNHKKAKQNIPTPLTRAANPSLDLRVAKSDYKHSNLILSAVYMVFRHNLISQKHAPEQLSTWSAAETVMVCTTKKFVKSVSAQITSKCCFNPQNRSYSAYFLLLFLCWCDTSSWCHTFCHGQQKSPKKQAPHLTCWALCIGKFGVCFLGLNLSPWSSLSAFHFGMVIWNDWKRELSRQEVTHTSGKNATIGQLV